MQIIVHEPVVGQVPNTSWNRDHFPTTKAIVAITAIPVELPDRVPAANIACGDWVVLAQVDGTWSTAFEVLDVFQCRHDARLAMDLPEVTRRVVPTWGYTINYDARNCYLASADDIAAAQAQQRADDDVAARMLANGARMTDALTRGQQQADDDV